MALVEEIRAACARVAAAARHVWVVEEAVAEYAMGLPTPSARELEPTSEQQLEDSAAYWLQLDAINFGSGWFPTLRKAPGASGFRTIEAGMNRRGAWPADRLVSIEADEIAAALGQDPAHELMHQFAGHLRELGARVLSQHGGSFLELARCGEGSAVTLVEHLASWDTFRDIATYDGHAVPFLKRAQITASDLHHQGIARARDLHRLTLFADNLVPHVLRVDGVLGFDSALTLRIEQEELLEHGSPEEVEIRACAVHAVELLVAAHGDTTAAAIDGALWHRGAGARYKATPRHRARCIAY
jgi:hypothetical protein